MRKRTETRVKAVPPAVAAERQPTIRDVAQASGVSTATVSHVLNGRDDRVGPDTRERVLATIRALNYRPPAALAPTVARETKNVIVVIGSEYGGVVYSDRYTKLVMEGLTIELTRNGYSVTLTTANMWDNVNEAVRMRFDGKADGVLMVTPRTGSALPGALQQRGLPVVVIGATPEATGVSSIDLDNHLAGYELTKHFVELGHERIGYCTTSSRHTSSVEREAGFRRAIEDAGLPGANAMRFERSTTGQLVDDVLAVPEDRRPTALIFWHDQGARRAIDELVGRGVRVPYNMSVAGVDDTPDATERAPLITSYSHAIHQIGIRAAQILLRRLAKPTAPSEHLRVRGQVLVRESSAPPGA